MSNPADELVDVVDEEGRTIATVRRREIRERRLPHRCVYLLVFNSQGELFIHQRTSTKDVYPSHWDVCVGGVLAAGEMFDTGARRELEEELGVQADPLFLFHHHYGDQATVAHGAVFRVTHNGPFRLQREEIVFGEFVSVPEAMARTQRQPFCPDGVEVLAEYRRRYAQIN